MPTFSCLCCKNIGYSSHNATKQDLSLDLHCRVNTRCLKLLRESIMQTFYYRLHRFYSLIKIMILTYINNVSNKAKNVQ